MNNLSTNDEISIHFISRYDAVIPFKIILHKFDYSIIIDHQMTVYCYTPLQGFLHLRNYYNLYDCGYVVIKNGIFQFSDITIKKQKF